MKWHVYYRTHGMSEDNAPGWRRSDVQADTEEQALSMAMERHKNINKARVYPAATGYAVTIAYEAVVIVDHVPHVESIH